MALTAGTRLGPYEILDPVGAGAPRHGVVTTIAWQAELPCRR